MPIFRFVQERWEQDSANPKPLSLNPKLQTLNNPRLDPKTRV